MVKILQYKQRAFYILHYIISKDYIIQFCDHDLLHLHLCNCRARIPFVFLVIVVIDFNTLYTLCIICSSLEKLSSTGVLNQLQILNEEDQNVAIEEINDQQVNIVPQIVINTRNYTGRTVFILIFLQ